MIQREQTSFQVESDGQRGLQLQHCLSVADLAAVTDPCSTQASQALGRQMRQLDVEAFEVPSARAPLEIRPDGVTFASFGLSQVVTLLREQLSKPSRVSPNYVIWS